MILIETTSKKLVRLKTAIDFTCNRIMADGYTVASYEGNIPEAAVLRDLELLYNHIEREARKSGILVVRLGSWCSLAKSVRGQTDSKTGD